MTNAIDPKFYDLTPERSAMEEEAWISAAAKYADADEATLISAFVEAGLAHYPYFSRVRVAEGREAAAEAWATDGFREEFFTTRDESRAMTRILSDRDPALLLRAEDILAEAVKEVQS